MGTLISQFLITEFHAIAFGTTKVKAIEYFDAVPSNAWLVVPPSTLQNRSSTLGAVGRLSTRAFLAQSR
jgi:hypothetical protein